jgi:hypothetical protein
MLVYDVEVLEVHILDEDVQALLSDAQRGAIASEVGRRREELRMLDERAKEVVNRAVYDAQCETLASELRLEIGMREVTRARVEAKAEATRIEVIARATQQARCTEGHEHGRGRGRRAPRRSRAGAARVEGRGLQGADGRAAP